FFSGTYFGETLSLAAAIACIKKLEEESVLEKIAAKGEYLMQQLTTEFSTASLLKVEGHPSCSRIIYPNQAYKTYHIQALIRRGVLSAGANNLCYAHTDSAISGG